MSSPFNQAMERACDDDDRYGLYENDTENGALRSVGVARSSAVELRDAMVLMFPVLGGGEAQDRALLAIIEIALATGVHLERGRWES